MLKYTALLLTVISTLDTHSTATRQKTKLFNTNIAMIGPDPGL